VISQSPPRRNRWTILLVGMGLLYLAMAAATLSPAGLTSLFVVIGIAVALHPGREHPIAAVLVLACGVAPCAVFYPCTIIVPIAAVSITLTGVAAIASRGDA
jgi:hypothetical protein